MTTCEVCGEKLHEAIRVVDCFSHTASNLVLWLPREMVTTIVFCRECERVTDTETTWRPANHGKGFALVPPSDGRFRL